MDRWQEKRILILGTTYPTYSSKYTENVCTGGLEDLSYRMVRLHPVPLRYLDGSHRFHAFQWIVVKTMQLENDPRPESLRIDPHSIILEELISDHSKRRRYVENSPHMCLSVEELMAKISPRRADAVREGQITFVSRDGTNQIAILIDGQKTIVGIVVYPYLD